MKLLPSLFLRPLVAALLFPCAAAPLVAQQAVPAATSAPTMPDAKLTPGDTLQVRRQEQLDQTS